MGTQVQHADTLASVVASLAQRVSNLETSLGNNHGTISNGNLTVLYADGNVAMVYGLQEDGTFGLWQYPDETGAYPGSPSVKLGELATSLWGLGVLPYGGSELQQVGGALSVVGGTQTNITTTTEVAVSGCSLTADIGPSGSALVTVNTSIATSANGVQGILRCWVDGADTTRGVVASNSTGEVSATVATNFVWTGMTPGTHTFALYMFTANPGANGATFYYPTLIVQPL